MSEGLSRRITDFNADGYHFTDDSIGSEARLKDALMDVKKYAKERVEAMGGELKHLKKVSLRECREYFERAGGPSVNPDEDNNVYMEPDGGILVATFNGHKYPILISEDKVQGTNDRRRSQGSQRQSLGNAIERAAKNIRGAEMLLSEMNVFPYVLFASGCDFHHTETIAKRLEMMNFGIPNHYIEVKPNETPNPLDLSKIDITKRFGDKCIASIFIKAHKWDVMDHGSSKWSKDELVSIYQKVIDQSIDSISSILNT